MIKTTLNSSSITKRRLIFITFLIIGLIKLPNAVAADEIDPRDPWIGYNRFMFKFNEIVVDRYLLRPLAVSYREFTPLFVKQGIQNFFSNLGDVITIPNDLLQGKVHQAGNDTARFIFNTTFGLVGLLDPASSIGLEHHKEDFGQTFGRWGIPRGPYVVLPFLGPSTVRDSVGLLPEYVTEPTVYLSDETLGFLLFGVEALDVRSKVLDGEGFIKGDKYIFVREAYIQNRDYLTNDGIEEDPFLEEDW